jgi:hypothetical protein
VEFDTYDNGNGSQIADPNGNHIGIDVNGSMVSIATATVQGGALKDGSIWYSWIDYNGGALQVRLNQSGIKPSSALLTFNIGIAQLLGGDVAYAGFTAGEAAGYGNHDILAWDYAGTASSVPESATLTLLGVAFAGVGVARRATQRRCAVPINPFPR